MTRLSPVVTDDGRGDLPSRKVELAVVGALSGPPGPSPGTHVTALDAVRTPETTPVIRTLPRAGSTPGHADPGRRGP
ncbi:hypothetical protein FCH28_29760 [Streptomyces piniterrae]|uniref:Uncharacterized protein n=1 Tax=Streptomyces piniterrae TaxID=2571125 RepID=A0A4V5MI94_9ACTN|nr:hypothetical protein [Streptomyces piniterrae]TJZ44528.1 hypothetical protein FCH28_29760 [Streptomyces piniterrae]